MNIDKKKESSPLTSSIFLLFGSFVNDLKENSFGEGWIEIL